jgi:hypothetical protein
MDQPPTKMSYITPQLFWIELSQEQAILSACSLAANSRVSGGGANCRPGNNCKQVNVAGDSGARAS